MSRENVELVRAIYAGWEGGDYKSADWADPEIQFVIAEGPTTGQWQGLAGMAEGVREWLSAWEDLRFEPEEYRELDNERVLVLFHFHARGKASGLDLGMMRAEAASVFHIRGGKVTRLVQYADRARALEALGLRE